MNIQLIIQLIIQRIFLGSSVLLLISCGAGEDTESSATGTTPETIQTAPSMQMELQSLYGSGRFDVNLKNDAQQEASAKNVTLSNTDLINAVSKYTQNIEAYNNLGNAILDVTASSPAFWDINRTYSLPGSQVRFSQGEKHGVFINKWWSRGDRPLFSPNYGPWTIVKRTNAVGEILQIKDTIETWSADTPYSGGNLVNYTIGATTYCFEAKYWNNNTAPILAGGETGVAAWQSPWKQSSKCSSTEDATNPIELIGGGKPPIEQPPVGENPPEGTPIVPPVIPTIDATPIQPQPTPNSIVTEPSTGLPSSGYAFLRKVTTENWDWMFPLRSGKYNLSGSVRNQPPFASPDGTKDVFTLANFKKAVLEYNAWAKSKGYKQFLNEGTVKQQAQEFLAFWGKACRETSGSWSTAASPWIVDYTNSSGQTTKVWKGCLYWIEEVGYSTNADGTSAALNYIDSGSSYAPEPNRSYYGRGIVQLSWNYNYGAFSAWLYDNGLMLNLITSKRTLLIRPDYVANNGQLSILSAIWFWMTPQGAKPSSHDVLYGDVYNVSQTTQQQGLPQRNDGGSIPTAAGDTNNEAIMAYRFGTIINIVNGGLECNRAAKWHGGPPQRVSYFNAFTLYFNEQFPELHATQISDALNIWNTKVTEASSEVIKNATCYSQKSYYGW